MPWKPLDYSQRQQAQWRASLAKLMDVPPADIEEWELQHLMRTIESVREMVIRQSTR